MKIPSIEKQILFNYKERNMGIKAKIRIQLMLGVTVVADSTDPTLWIQAFQKIQGEDGVKETPRNEDILK